ncbi:MAG TPA: PQQ-binding-like beta-propeller repeat protein [Planctomycetes bacterium]|nr:PQQ-binding-like beta-propeller repeat protein [Planctomycetota bacterium]
MRMKTRTARLAVCLVLFLGFLHTCYGAAPAETDWPMLAHDVARTGATSTEIRPPFERKWYRIFPNEGLMAGIQPIIADGKVFVGTMRGILHAMDSDTGKDLWKLKMTGAILHTCAVADNKVFFGNAEGKVYAVNARDGRLLWFVQTGSAVWNSPLVYEGVVVVGSRDGALYSIDAETGRIRWKALMGGPLLSSVALDIETGRLYIGSEDMHVYAFDFHTGSRFWRSNKLPGVSFRGYHPVIAPDGSVMITVTPGISLDSFTPVLHDMVKKIFGDFASWRHTKEENERLRRENFKVMEEPGTYKAQLHYIRQRLNEQPIYQTFFVLHPDTGRQKFVAPIVYAESMNGTGAPPIVTPDGKVVVKFRALLRSRYQHYSPFLNVGYLDTSIGYITPIMDQSRTYGWHDSLLLVHDEQCQLTVGGRVLINTHQDNVNGMDLDTLVGCSEPFCRNIHEPKPGEAVGIWADIFRGQSLPVGKEWLPRGTAVYGGGSVIDMPISIAGDSFYYIPTHEINAGAAVIAYKMQAGGSPMDSLRPAGKASEPPNATLTDSEWKKVQQLPWDWDMLGMSRLNHLLESLPGKIPGTRQQPLTQQASGLVDDITDAELDRFIWEVPAVQFTDSSEWAPLETKLSRCVTELISKEWRPLLFPVGKHPREAYRLFIEPTETLYTLARAYKYIDGALQRDVKQYIAARMSSTGGPLEGPVGRRRYDQSVGAVRSLYDVPPENMMQVRDDIVRSDLARLYPLWLWADASGDWSGIESNWKFLRKLIEQPPNKMAEDCRNGYLAGLIAYCRVAARMNDDEAVEKGVVTARRALRERLAYEFAHPHGGLITQVPVLRSIFGRWRHLTPEIGRLCANYALQTHKHLMDVYVDYHRPTWYLAWNVETMWRNECPFAFPTMAMEVFAARALILREPAEKLTRFLDIPSCKADLFYIRKLLLAIEAHGKVVWRTDTGLFAAGSPR